MQAVKAIVLVLLTTLLGACSDDVFYTPLPADKMQYAGEWRADGVLMLIEPRGRMVFVRNSDRVKTNLDLPIKEFKGDNMIVGMWSMTTEFVVAKPPHEEDGVWKMTVNGIEVTRSSTTTD